MQVDVEVEVMVVVRVVVPLVDNDEEEDVADFDEVTLLVEELTVLDSEESVVVDELVELLVVEEDVEEETTVVVLLLAFEEVEVKVLVRVVVDVELVEVWVEPISCTKIKGVLPLLFSLLLPTVEYD